MESLRPHLGEDVMKLRECNQTNTAILWVALLIALLVRFPLKQEPAEIRAGCAVYYSEKMEKPHARVEAEALLERAWSCCLDYAQGTADCLNICSRRLGEIQQEAAGWIGGLLP